VRWEEAGERANDTQRARDLRLIDRLLEIESLSNDERSAFASMQQYLQSRPGLTLSSKQRGWLEKTADRVGDVGEYTNMVSSGQVPNTPTRIFDFERMKKPTRPPGR
jgi:hypothetical protein